MKKIFYIICAGVAAIGIASCTGDELEKSSTIVDPSAPISFTATLSPTIEVTRAADPLSVTGYTRELWLIPSVENTVNEVTRGTQLTSTSALNNFGVSAYLHGSTEDITQKRPDFFYNKEAVLDANTGKYGFTQDFYWPTSTERLSFMAYAPYGSALAVLADAGKSQPDPGAQKINFTVAATVTDQVDLMTATTMLQSPSTTQTPSVELNFKHQLAGIRFVIGSQFPTKGYIQSITLNNVYSGGTYTLTDGATPGSWEYGGRTDFVTSYTADEQLTGEPGQVITKPTQTFLMLPCTFANNDVAKVVIDYWDGYETHTVESSLANVTWEAGKTYTYELSSQKLTKLKVQSIGFAPTVNGAPYVKWQNGDKVGMYVVKGKTDTGEPDGQTLRYSNIPVTCTVTTVGNNEVVTWEVDHTAQGNVYKFPGDSYYFYYPYVEGNPPGYPNECNELDADAPTFFSSLITAHGVEADQSTPTNFKKSDLQVAKAVVPEDNGSNLPASTIKATMSRQVGLARIRLQQNDPIVTTVKYVDGVLTESTGSTTVVASSVFDVNKPFINGNTYYYYTVKEVETSFNSAANVDNYWKENLSVTLNAGETSDVLVARSHRVGWTYLNAVWDFTCTGSPVPFTTSSEGEFDYVFEVWGASGISPKKVTAEQAATTFGAVAGVYGFGGYARGTVNLASSKSIYVCVGSEGGNPKTKLNGNWYDYLDYEEGEVRPGYNGGGVWLPNHNVMYGGGATHIASATGELASLKNNKAAVYIVAGGGGSSDGIGLEPYNRVVAYAGNGGGLTGGNAIAKGIVNDPQSVTTLQWAATGGTQNAAGTCGHAGRPWSDLEAVYYTEADFGQAGYGCNNWGSPQHGTTPYEDWGSAGGGGWYGGGGNIGNACGGGGSSYIGGVSNGTTISGGEIIPVPVPYVDEDTNELITNILGRKGNGYARITLNRQ